jgi:hypothetical protein
MLKPTFTVIYRSGGTENFQWLKTCVFPSHAEAHTAKTAVENGGRPAFVYRSDILEAELAEGAFKVFDPTLAAQSRVMR